MSASLPTKIQLKVKLNKIWSKEKRMKPKKSKMKKIRKMIRIMCKLVVISKLTMNNLSKSNRNKVYNLKNRLAFN